MSETETTQAVVVEAAATEEVTQVVTETAETATTAEATAPQAAPTTDQAEDQLDVIEGKYRKAIDEIKGLRSMKNELRGEVDGLKAQLDEAAKSTAAVEEAKAKLGAMESQLKAERLTSTLTAVAASRRISDPALVTKLLPVERVEWNEDGKPSNVEALLDEIVAAHPVLATPGVGTATGAVLAIGRSKEPSSVSDLEGLSGDAFLAALNQLANRR
jgi:hypothetical protein